MPFIWAKLPEVPADHLSCIIMKRKICWCNMPTVCYNRWHACNSVGSCYTSAIHNHSDQTDIEAVVAASCRWHEHNTREVLQYVITCHNTYVIFRQVLRQVLVLHHMHVAVLWLYVKPQNPGCSLAPSSTQRKVSTFYPRVPKSKRWASHLTTKRPRWEKNRLRRETVARPEFTWFTYQENVEKRGRTSEATFVRFLRQDSVLQNLATIACLPKIFDALAQTIHSRRVNLMACNKTFCYGLAHWKSSCWLVKWGTCKWKISNQWF